MSTAVSLLFYRLHPQIALANITFAYVKTLKKLGYLYSHMYSSELNLHSDRDLTPHMTNGISCSHPIYT